MADKNIRIQIRTVEQLQALFEGATLAFPEGVELCLADLGVNYIDAACIAAEEKILKQKNRFGETLAVGVDI